MTREVDLVSYLPPYMAEFKEVAAALEAAEPEFALAWEAAERVLRNRFIETSDAYGISRLEKMLGIRPGDGDTLESRRSKVRSRWFEKLPYTMRVLRRKLAVLCGGAGFEISDDFGTGYALRIKTRLELYGQAEELERLLEAFLPCGITAEASNSMAAEAEGAAPVGGCVAAAEFFEAFQ